MTASWRVFWGTGSSSQEGRRSSSGPGVQRSPAPLTARVRSPAGMGAPDWKMSRTASVMVPFLAHLGDSCEHSTRAGRRSAARRGSRR